MLLRAPAKGLEGVGEAGHACRPAPEADAAVVARLAACASAFASPLTAAASGAGVIADGGAGWTVASSPDGLVAAAFG